MIAKVFGDRISKDEIVTISDLMAQAHRREIIKSVPDSINVQISFYTEHIRRVEFVMHKENCEDVRRSLKEVVLPGESPLECYKRLFKEEFMFVLE